MDIAKLLIISGIVLVVIGLAFTTLGQSGLPKLPGDIFIKRGNFTFYFPIVSSILISIVLSIVINFFMRK